MKILYGFLCVLGAVLPFSKIIPWLYQHDMSFSMLWLEIQYSPIGYAAWWSVLLVSLVALVFILGEGVRLRVPKLWLPIVCTVCLGASFGLPLFLLLREFHIERSNNSGRPLFL